MKIICKNCKKEFYIRPVSVKPNGNHCSVSCHNDWQRKNKKIGKDHQSWKGGKINSKCVVCGGDFLTRKSWVKKPSQGRFCSHRCAGTWILANSKKKDTSIEIKMEQELTRRGVIFQKQYPIWQAKTIPDFFIAPNICIYCDGDYWHNLPNVKNLNVNQNYCLCFLGYRVYRFWEHDINSDIVKCVDTIMPDFRSKL